MVSAANTSCPLLSDHAGNEAAESAHHMTPTRAARGRPSGSTCMPYSSLSWSFVCISAGWMLCLRDSTALWRHALTPEGWCAEGAANCRCIW